MQDSPVTRFRKYLETRSLWSEEQETTFKKEIRTKILTAFADAEKRNKPSIEHLFTEVYGGGEAEMPWNLKEQREELRRLIKAYPNDLPLTGHAKN